MKELRNKYFIAILTCFVFNQIIFAQKNDCAIYEKILIELNDEWNSVKYVDTGIVNPSNPHINKVRMEENQRLSFFVVKSKIVFNLVDVNQWFYKLLSDTFIIKNGYTRLQDSTVNCVFCSDIKYQFVELKEALSFSEKDYSSEGKGKKLTYYTPARIWFSNILYYNDEYALGYLRMKRGFGGGNGVICGFIFRKKKNVWILEKMKGESR